MNEQRLLKRGDEMVLSVKEVCRLLSIGRTTFYKLMRAGKLVARKLRGRTVVLRGDFEQFVCTLPRAGSVS